MADSAARATLRPDHLDFALRLHAQLTRSASEGLVWSPYSVACALALVATGARGTTRDELTALLGSDLRGHLAALDDAVTSGPELATSTELWIHHDLRPRSEFASTVRERPGSGLHTADFVADPDGARRAINEAVAATTRGLITELLAPGTVQPSTLAVLVNALWVRLRWHQPFDTAKTTRQRFHAPGGVRRVAMMRRQGRIGYAQARGWRMVTLPGENDLAFDVLLPDEHNSDELGASTLGELRGATATRDVALALPRFEITHSEPLHSTLPQLGVRTCFTARADLTGIAEGPLAIDQVIHQARLRVDEKGAEGAAATAVTMTKAALTRERPVTFTVDRPFIFVLRRREAILFLGRISNPDDPGPAS